MPGLNASAGTFFFDTEVDLTGFDPQMAQIVNVQYAADDSLKSVAVNGTDVFVGPAGGWRIVDLLSGEQMPRIC